MVDVVGRVEILLDSLLGCFIEDDAGTGNILCFVWSFVAKFVSK